MKARLANAMFNPPWWAIILNPHFLPRRALFRAMRESGPLLSGRVLDVGCGTQPYRELLTHANAVVGLELDTPENRAGKKNVDVFYDGKTLPFPDQSFQGVLCNQVLEHVAEPEQFLDELSRVLAPGGTLVLSVPFVWPEHERPWDNQRFTSYGLIHRLDAANFEIVRHTKLVAGGAALCALVADRINALVSSLPLVFRLACRALVIAPWTLLGCLLLLAEHPENGLFLDNFVVSRRKPK